MHHPAPRSLIAVGLVGLLVGGPIAFGTPEVALAASGLPPPDGTTTLVSKNLDGDFPSGPSVEASISENGRWVAFSSLAADLVPNDTNESQDVFIVDRRNERPDRLPLPGGDSVPKGGRAFDPSISADASTVAFTYLPPQANLTAVPPGPIVLVWDRDSNTTTVASRRLDGNPARNSREPSVSGDGQLVAYTSDDGRISPGDGNEGPDVYVFDRVSEQTTLVSANLDGRAPAGSSGRPSISANGRFVGFDSNAVDLVAEGVGTEVSNVYVRDLDENSTELVSVTLDGGYGNAASQAASVSSNGNVVAFESLATDLVENVTATQHIYVRDREAGSTELASIGPTDAPATGPSGQPSIAADGRIVVFISAADDLVASADSPIELAAVVPAQSEVYAREMVAGDTILISEAVDGGRANGSNVGPSVGGNGRYVAFASNSPRLVDGDDNQLADVFLRDLPGDPVIVPPELAFGASALGVPAIPVGAIVSNRGWAPVRLEAATRSGNHAQDFSILADGCADTRLRRAQACTITVGFTPSAQGNRTGRLNVPGGFSGSPLTARLRGSGSRAALDLDPPIGNPGIVTVVSGRGFPEGAKVELNWSKGITPHLTEIIADEDGRFRVQVLVFHHDLIGERELIATHAGGPLFPDVKAAMNVTASQDIPTTWDWQLQPPFAPPLIQRR